MICPACGYEMRYPASLSFTPEHPLRFYECVKCGWSGESLEQWRGKDDAKQALQAALWRITNAKREEARDEDSRAGS